MISDPTSLSDHVTVLLKEGQRRLLTLAALFSVVAVVALGVGLLLPKRYDASTLILVEANNIIKPLMEGRGVPTSVADQTAVVNQIVLGRKIMREVLLFGGWVQPPPKRQPDPREEERLLKQLRSHIKIESTRDEMVHISFSDSDPQRTYKVANKLAEIYVRESQAGKERESRDAFEFIDKQVKEYGDKLADIHEKVLTQYRKQPQKPGSVDAPVAAPQQPGSARSKISAEELADLRAEEALLTTQISRNSKATATGTRNDLRVEEQARSRVLQLQGELDRMLGTMTDEHPDVKRVKRELTTAKEELARAEKVVVDREAAAQLASQRDDDVARAAKSRIEDVRRRIAEATNTPIRRTETAAPRVAATTETNDEMRGVGRDTTLSELLRRYEATRDLYQDLLKRRENARVSMELDAQHRGFTMRVQEPAEMPASASSLRLMHLTLIGLFLALLVPIGFLVAIVRFDRRVRSPQQIQRLVPLLGSITYSPTHRERSRFRSRGMLAALMVVGVFVVYIATFLIKLRTT
ncbi:MAG: Lipopolysaccharide biosynthesis [Myxococcales bacterium]|nr:Lipopolysaccharide biosynthesis [Myxococcales bacterium]